MVQAAEAWRAHGAWVTAHPDAVGPGVRERFAIASEVTAGGGGRPPAPRSSGSPSVDPRASSTTPSSSCPPRPARPPPGPRAPPSSTGVRAATLRMTALAGIGGLPAPDRPRAAPPVRARAGTGRRLPRRPPRHRPVPRPPRPLPSGGPRMTAPGEPARPPAHGPRTGQRRPARAARDVHAAGRPVRPGDDRVHERDAWRCTARSSRRPTRRPCWSTARPARGSRRRSCRWCGPGERVLVPVFGRFGHLLAEIALRAQAEVHTIEVPWGQVFARVGRRGGDRPRPPAPARDGAGRHVDDDAPAARRARARSARSTACCSTRTRPRRWAATRSRWTRGASTPPRPGCRSACRARRAARRSACRTRPSR